MSSPNPSPSLHVLDAIEWLMRRLDHERATREAGDGAMLRGSQGRILHLLPAEGARPTELAAGDWITKQAIGQRVRELEEMGLVRIDPDPDDGRAVIVRRTPEGDRIQHEILEDIDAMERSWAEEVGDERYAVFRAVLDQLGAEHAAALLHRQAATPSDKQSP